MPLLPCVPVRCRRFAVGSTLLPAATAAAAAPCASLAALELPEATICRLPCDLEMEWHRGS